MSRRTTTKKKLAVPDPVYNSRLVSMLTVRILKEGKKHLAQRIIYQAFDIIKEKTGRKNINPCQVRDYDIRASTRNSQLLLRFQNANPSGFVRKRVANSDDGTRGATPHPITRGCLMIKINQSNAFKFNVRKISR